MRKAQVTIFVILGIILAATIIILFAFRESVMEEATKMGIVKGEAISAEAEKVKLGVTNCLEAGSYDVLYKLGVQGGYIYFDQTPYVRLQDGLNEDGTAYLYYQGQNNVPSVDKMEADLEREFLQISKDCENKFKGLEVTYGTIKPHVQIRETEVLFNFDWPIEVQKDDTKSRITSLAFDVPIRLGLIRDAADEIVQTQEEKICLSCLTFIGFKNDFTIDIDNLEEDETFYMITDANSRIGSLDYGFFMANKF